MQEQLNAAQETERFLGSQVQELQESLTQAKQEVHAGAEQTQGLKKQLDVSL